MTDLEAVRPIAERAAAAARRAAVASAAERNAMLEAMADGLARGRDAVLAANARDLEAGAAAGLSAALLDRLRLDDERLAEMAEGLRTVAGLPDPVGRVLSDATRPNGLRLTRVSVPIGVILMIYEARPNVTADAAGLCLKAGNAVILKGGSEALASNLAVHAAMLDGGARAGLPEHAVQLVASADRAAVHALLDLDDLVDLVIPRGGAGLIEAVAGRARMPVLKHDKGVCHVYVDRAADLDMARAIAVNAKCQRPGVCNAMETLLVHADAAGAFVPAVGAALEAAGVEIRGDETVRRLLPGARAADEADWSAEYLDLVLAVRVVPDLAAAIDHVARYGSHHSDVIVTADEAAAERFLREVDSAAVYVNASSRFTDGGQFGLGAEIGISTNRLHARGPCGLEELTTYKWVVRGTGQVRA
ncbi:MAG: glutamate-5-semialdehyde dehydrogenase [Planctomycetota bacterium]|jgi:glutamate-5-semialdehyde dehydrogenase